MGKKLRIFFALILAAALLWAAPAVAQSQKEKSDSSDDFRNTYPAELKKKETWQSGKRRGSGAFRETYSPQDQTTDSAAPARPAEPQPSATPEFEPQPPAPRSSTSPAPEPQPAPRRETRPRPQSEPQPWQQQKKASQPQPWQEQKKSSQPQPWQEQKKDSQPQPWQEQKKASPPPSRSAPPSLPDLSSLPSSLPEPATSWDDNSAPAYTPPPPAADEPVYSPPPPPPADEPVYSPPPAAEEPAYSPPPAAPQSSYQDPADYMPPPGYYDGSSPAPRSESRPAADQPVGGQTSGGVDNSAFDQYQSPPPEQPARPAAEAEPVAPPAVQEPAPQYAEPRTQSPPEEESFPTAVENAPADGSWPPPAPPVTAPPAAQIVPSGVQTDYANADSWMYLPSAPDRDVDIFFLHTGACEGQGVCSVSDAGLRQKALEKTGRQAGAFETVGNLFAPYIRQLNAASFLALSPADRAGGLAPSSTDAYQAFDYYLRNHNQGRPFILAAHGQGSAALLEGILSRYLEHNVAVRRQLVAAYAIGYSVTTDFLGANPHLRIAERRNDVGVIISYSTQAPGLKADNPAVLPKSVAINPVNWSRSERRALPKVSQGADLRVFGEEEFKEAFADARVNMARGVVECSTAAPDKYSSPGFPQGAFPDGDYAFYYYDLRANAQERVDAYRQRTP